MGLLDYFEYDQMAISADLGFRKPHPDIFMYALNRLNVLPEETAMVGDSLQADIVGAKMLNMLSIWKPKAPLRQDAKVAWMSSYNASREHQMQSSVGQNVETLFDEAPPNVLIHEDKNGFTDDNLLAYVQNRDNTKQHQLPDDIKPDMVIENLSELLRIF
jgi:FMN phosphatase YigB (HAD superfamily)